MRPGSSSGRSRRAAFGASAASRAAGLDPVHQGRGAANVSHRLGSHHLPERVTDGFPCPFPVRGARRFSGKTQVNACHAIVNLHFAANPIVIVGKDWNGIDMTIDEIFADFELLDDWEDRYRYVIELGKTLEPLPDSGHTAENKVQGCVSQVWLVTRVEEADDGRGPALSFIGDSDAHIVRGLVAILFAIYSGKPADEILELDAQEIFLRLGLKDHLTPQRSNGFVAMVERIRSDARAALDAAQGVH